MTVTISLRPEMEVELRERAAAVGKDVSAFVLDAIEEKLSTANGRMSAGNKPYDRWSAEFSSWMNDVSKRSSMYPCGYTADDSRESLYGDPRD
jgi:hypothetical protein